MSLRRLKDPRSLMRQCHSDKECTFSRKDFSIDIHIFLELPAAERRQRSQVVQTPFHPRSRKPKNKVMPIWRAVCIAQEYDCMSENSGTNIATFDRFELSYWLEMPSAFGAIQQLWQLGTVIFWWRTVVDWWELNPTRATIIFHEFVNFLLIAKFHGQHPSSHPQTSPDCILSSWQHKSIFFVFIGEV